MWESATDGATLFANALDWVSPPDTDGDTLKDVVDNCVFVASLDQADTDGDGIGDPCDLCAGGVDTDADGICDDADACPGANDWQDTDATPWRTVGPNPVAEARTVLYSFGPTPRLMYTPNDAISNPSPTLNRSPLAVSSAR